jgi:hypothetical protein
MKPGTQAHDKPCSGLISFTFTVRRVYIRICDGLSRSLWSQPGSQPDCYKTVLIRNSKYALVHILDVWYVFESWCNFLLLYCGLPAVQVQVQVQVQVLVKKLRRGPNLVLHGAPKIEFHRRFLGAWSGRLT